MCWLWDSTEGKDRHEFCESCPDLLFLFQYKLGAIAVKNSYLTCPSPEHQEGPEGKLNPIQIINAHLQLRNTLQTFPVVNIWWLSAQAPCREMMTGPLQDFSLPISQMAPRYILFCKHQTKVSIWDCADVASAFCPAEKHEQWWWTDWTEIFPAILTSFPFFPTTHFANALGKVDRCSVLCNSQRLWSQQKDSCLH